MRLNTHDRTPRVKTSKFIKTLFGICYGLIVAIFVLVAFACFYYADGIIGGFSVIMLVIIMAALIEISCSDINRAYVEIVDNNINVVDYYCLIKREKHFVFQDIASAEIVAGYSFRVRGYRIGVIGSRYIVLRNAKKKYLFKIIYLPETKAIFEKFIVNN